MPYTALDQDEIPACWEWPTPTSCTFANEREAEYFLRWWHNDCCAICERSRKLVTDHDHETGLIRGFLCTSCNVREALSDSPVFGKYRERNPASILGIRLEYVGWNSAIEQAERASRTPPEAA